MEFRININEKILFILLIIVSLVSAIGITIAQPPPDPGHPWSEIECAGCIGTSNLADDAVTGDKIANETVTADKVNFNYATSNSKGGNASNSDKVDGYDASEIAGWGSPCGAVWSGCPTCCGTGTNTCNYYGRELNAMGTTICVTTASTQGSCGSQSCTDYSCC